MQYPFLLHHANGRIWLAGNSVYSLCSAWNQSTNPSLPMTESEHNRASQYARAIRNRMKRCGYRLGDDYIELSNGALWPIINRAK